MSHAGPAKPIHTSKWALNALTIVLCILWAIPILWAIIVSLRPRDDALGRGDIWFGEHLSAESYQIVNQLAPFFPHVEDGQLTPSYYQNTLQYVLTTLSVQLITIPLAAFAFVHFEFPGKKILFYLILAQMMIPTASLLVPNFVTIRELGLYDTTLANAVPYFGSAFGTFLMRQAFLEVPTELVEAGQIVATGLRLVLAPLLALWLADRMGLVGLNRSAMLLEASMPTAVLVTVLATEYDVRPRLLTTILVLSSLLSPFTLAVFITWAGL